MLIQQLIQTAGCSIQTINHRLMVTTQMLTLIGQLGRAGTAEETIHNASFKENVPWKEPAPELS